jgi:hypothetical protein
MSNPPPHARPPIDEGFLQHVMELDEANFRFGGASSFFVPSILCWIFVAAVCVYILHATRPLGVIASASEARLELKIGIVGQLVLIAVLLRWRGWLTVIKIASLILLALAAGHVLFGSEIPLP